MTPEEIKESLDRNGGRAFPCEISAIETNGSFVDITSGGMSLRDWFAGQALVGLTSLRGGKIDREACMAYEYADAILIARTKKPEAADPSRA